MSNVCEVRCRSNQSYVGEELCGVKYNQTGSAQGAAAIQVAGYSAQFNRLVAGGGQSKIDDAAGVTGSVMVAPTLGVIARYFIGSIGKKFSDATRALSGRNFSLTGLNPLAVDAIGIRTDYTFETLTDALEREYGKSLFDGSYRSGIVEVARIDKMFNGDVQPVSVKVTLGSPHTYDLKGTRQERIAEGPFTGKRPVNVTYLVEYEFEMGGKLAEIRVIRHKFQARPIDTLKMDVVFKYVAPGKNATSETRIPETLLDVHYTSILPRIPDSLEKRRAVAKALVEWETIPINRRIAWERAFFLSQLEDPPIITGSERGPGFDFVQQRVAKILKSQGIVQDSVGPSTFFIQGGPIRLGFPLFYSSGDARLTSADESSNAQRVREGVFTRPGEGIRDVPRDGEGLRTVERAGSARAGETTGSERSKAPERRRGHQFMEWFKKGRGR